MSTPLSIRFRGWWNLVFRHDRVPSALEQPSLSPEQVDRLRDESVLILRRRHRSPGSALPEPLTKHRLRVAFSDKCADLQYWLRRHGLRLRAQLSALDLVKPAQFGTRLLSEMQAEFKRRHRRFAEEYLPAKVDALVKQEALEDFRRANRRKEAPFEPEHPLMPFARMNVGTVVDMILSGPIYAQGRDYGLVEGMVYALLFSLLIVGLGFFTGFVGLRLATHVRVLRRALGTSLAAVGLAISSIYILALGHMRLLMASRPEASLWDGLISLWASPWAFTMSPEATLLIALSFAILIMAVREGRSGFADPYWGYPSAVAGAALADELAAAVADNRRVDDEARGKEFLDEARKETVSALEVWNRACVLGEEALQHLNDVELSAQRSRQTTELLLKEADGVLDELGFPLGAAASGLPPATIPPPSLPVGAGNNVRMLPPADLLKEFSDGREAMRDEGRRLVQAIQEQHAGAMETFDALKCKLDAKARGIVAAPFWQRGTLASQLDDVAP